MYAFISFLFLFLFLFQIWFNKNIPEYLQFLFDYSPAQAFFSKDFQQYNTGFFAVKSTLFTRNLFAELLQFQRQNPNENEQNLFNQLLFRTTRTNSLKINELEFLDPLLFTNGKVFFKLKLNEHFNLKPYTVHANFMIGKKNKMTALKNNNMWFIDKKYE